MKWFTFVFCLASMLLVAFAYSPKSKDDADSVPEVIVPPECIGKEICLVKPPGYPTEEIDRVAQTLKRRAKREVNEKRYTAANGDEKRFDDINNCVARSEVAQPYLVHVNEWPQYVIQSSFYKQQVIYTSCGIGGEGAACFQDFRLPKVRTHCQTQHVSSFLKVYDSRTKKTSDVSVEIPVNCACVIKRDKK